MKKETKPKPNRGRHAAECKICRHPQRDEIERAFINWRSPERIAEDFALNTRQSVYRHAWALELFPKRAANVRAALETIIEKAAEVDVNASAVVAAVAVYGRINSSGRWVERSETVNLNELFQRMTTDELEQYAKTARLPAWFPVGVTPVHGPNGKTDD